MDKGFGEVLRARREGMGLTQRQLAALVGVDDSNFCHYERGETVPCGEVLSRLTGIVGELPAVEISVEGKSVGAGDQPWVGKKGAAPCAGSGDGRHKFWRSRAGSVRVCDLCPTVEVRR